MSGAEIALAQSVTTPGDRDLIRERQNRLLQQQQQKLEELKQLPGAQEAAPELQLPTDSRCFEIREIALTGADHLSIDERQAIILDFAGKCLGVTQLNELLRRITNHYVEQGFVTSRAYLPQQDLASGKLEVLVVEGRLEGFQHEPGAVTDREIAFTYPGAVGEPLNLRHIEQMVDQLNRLQSNHVEMELLPGRQLGGSQVAVKNQPDKPWRVSLARHNDGQRSTGEQQWNTGFEWDSPLGMADQLVINGGHDAVSDSHRSSKNAYLLYNLPWGWWNFSYSYSRSEYGSQTQSDGFSFDQSGDSSSHSLRAERLIHRDALSKTSISTGVTRLRTHNYIEDSLIDVSSNQLTELQFGINHGRRIGSAFVNADLGYQRGIGAFGAQGDDSDVHGSPSARYGKYTLTLSYLQSFQLWDETFSFSSLLSGQHSDDVLYGPQRTSLGGLSSIRGFKDQSLTGDSGGYWRNDLRWVRPINNITLRPVFAQYGASVGYDVGVIRHTRDSGEQHGRMTGNALSLFAQGQHVSATVTYARSLERPSGIAREHPLYFRLDFFF